MACKMMAMALIASSVPVCPIALVLYPPPHAMLLDTATRSTNGIEKHLASGQNVPRRPRPIPM